MSFVRNTTICQDIKYIHNIYKIHRKGFKTFSYQSTFESFLSLDISNNELLLRSINILFCDLTMLKSLPKKSFLLLLNEELFTV